MSDTRKLSPREFFNALGPESLDLVDAFYAPAVSFHDPICAIKGTKKLKAYYERLYGHAKSVKFHFSSEIEKDDVTILSWTMTLAMRGINGGYPIKVEGLSYLRYDASREKVIYHRDYFDMGAMVYERLPVLGLGIRAIRHHMAP